MLFTGIVISLLLDAMNVGVAAKQHQFVDFLISILITIIVWEGNLRIDTRIDRHYPWEKSAGRRIMIQLPINIVFSAFSIYLSMLAFNAYVCEFPVETKKQFTIVAIIVGVLVSIILLTVEVSSQFFSKWKRSLVEVEKYKAESLQAQLQNLKDQVNPHFLFNNLSVLSSLVYKDQDKAVDFINQLSKVYRYLLDSRNSELVTLRDELTFVHSYAYLLQIRFDKNLIFLFDIPKAYEGYSVPPMALQILIENAIKHNEVSSELPLTISVTIKGDTLQIANNLQKRTMHEGSSKTGLKNICDRYLFFTNKTVEIEETPGTFTVRIPLLKLT